MPELPLWLTTHVAVFPDISANEGQDWLAALSLGLTLLWTEAGSLSAEELALLEGILNREMSAHPDEFLAVQESVANQFGFEDPIDTEGAAALIALTEGLIDALTGAGSTRARNILTNIQENRTRTEEQTQTTTVTATGETTETTDRRVTEFIEIMTPEEFLDNFTVGFTTFIDNLFRVGALDLQTFDAARANPELFFGPYLAELGRRADVGEDIFTVVGLEGAAERLGERFGGTVTEDTLRVSEEERISETELTELINETVTRLTASTIDGEPQDINETIRSVIENVFTGRLETTTREEFRNIATTITIEEIFGRPRIATVASLSPLDFLRGQFPPISIANLIAQETGGQPVRTGGVVPSAPRRLG